MNSLSWLIYAAEICDRAREFTGLIAFMIGSLGGIGITVLWAVTVVEELRRAPAIICSVLWALIVLPCIAISILLPSSKTIYLIAASEAGETVVTNPDTIEMMGDLKAIIKKRLKEELGE